MGQIAATVIDVADIRSYDCLLPDDVQVSQLAFCIAETIGFKTVGSDGTPLNYGLIVKRGKVLDPHKTLHELNPGEPLELRLVPEVVANQDEVIDELTVTPESDDDEYNPVHIDILGVNALVDYADVNLRPDVRIDAKIHREIDEFAGQDRYKEFAGLLLGSVEIEGNVRVIHITAMIPAIKAIGTRSEVKITLDAWESMLRVRDEEYRDLRVLGWFHSHAGWDVFMSDADVFIHKNFFPHLDMIAYVLDLLSGHDGFFYWKGEILALAPNFGLVVTRDENDLCGHSEKKSRLPLIRNCIIALLLIGVIFFGGANLLPLIKGRAKPKHTPPVVTTAASDKRVEEEDRTYTISEHDSLWNICNKVYNDNDLADELARYNGLNDYTGLQVGQEIKLPPQEVLEAMSDN